MPFCYLCTSGINELFILTPTKPYELSRYNFSLTFCASDIVELNTWNLYKNLTTYNTDEMTHCGLAVLHDITISDHSRTEGWPTAKWAVGYFLFLIPVLIWYWDSQQLVLFLFFFHRKLTAIYYVLMRNFNPGPQRVSDQYISNVLSWHWY